MTKTAISLLSVYGCALRDAISFSFQRTYGLQGHGQLSLYPMNSLKFSIALLIGLFLTGCQSKPSTESDAHSGQSTAQTPARSQAVADLEKQVLAVHDSVMPAMSELMALKKEVTQQLADLDGQSPSVALNQRKAQGQAVSAALTLADKAMMNWMHQYNGDTLETLNEEQAMAYLKAQQQQVNAMSQLMRQSITNAQNYLK